MIILKASILFLRTLPLPRATLALENLALRQQLAVYQQSIKRPKLCPSDRVFWVLLSRLWRNWKSALCIVQPETVVAWHRQGFRIYWRWISRGGNSGRPTISSELRELIRTMCRENPTWGAPRICSELALLGHDIAERTVAKYMLRERKPPSQTWTTFLNNHVPDIAACDFFTVPTATFRVLYVFIIINHDRRKVVHFNVTTNPNAPWAAQQIVNAFPYESSPRFLIRDQDGCYGEYFQSRIEQLDITEVTTAAGAPWQNAYAERIIGSIRRECLDHLIVLNEIHLRRLLKLYFDYYHNARPHLSLDRNSPIARELEPPCQGRVISQPMVGGLHHRYSRAA